MFRYISNTELHLNPRIIYYDFKDYPRPGIFPFFKNDLYRVLLDCLKNYLSSYLLIATLNNNLLQTNSAFFI